MFIGIFRKKDNIVNKVKKLNLTYLSKSALKNLQKQVSLTSDLEGIFIETGCALGGSSIVIAHSKPNDKEFYIYDVFGMIPPPSHNDGEDVHERYETIKMGKSSGIGGNVYYGYKENLLVEVKKNFNVCDVSLHNIWFVEGLYQDTLKIKSPVAFAHIDCDWYESVLVCLNQIVPNLVRGGVIVIDDYSAWSGCKKAVDEYFENLRSSFRMDFGEKLTITKLN